MHDDSTGDFELKPLSYKKPVNPVQSLRDIFHPTPPQPPQQLVDSDFDARSIRSDESWYDAMEHQNLLTEPPESPGAVSAGGYGQETQAASGATSPEFPLDGNSFKPQQRPTRNAWSASPQFRLTSPGEPSDLMSSNEGRGAPHPESPRLPGAGYRRPQSPMSNQPWTTSPITQHWSPGSPSGTTGGATPHRRAPSGRTPHPLWKAGTSNDTHPTSFGQKVLPAPSGPRMTDLGPDDDEPSSAESDECSTVYGSSDSDSDSDGADGGGSAEPSPLLQAAARGDLDRVRELVQDGADVNGG